MNNSLNIVIKSFSDLTINELYAIMALRQEVFVVEQNCPYQDADGKDLLGHHLMMLDSSGVLVAYTRLLPQGVSYPDYTSIGRVVNSPSIRRKGIGLPLMQASIEAIATLYSKATPIKIGAQSYLIPFYEKCGFVNTQEHYLEDGIPHTKMIYYW